MITFDSVRKATIKCLDVQRPQPPEYALSKEANILTTIFSTMQVLHISEKPEIEFTEEQLAILNKWS